MIGPLAGLLAVWMVAGAVVERVLDRRQARAIEAHRHTVPDAFAGSVSLEAHQTAARHGLERLRVSAVERPVVLAFGLVMVLVGLPVVAQVAAGMAAPGLWRSLGICGVLWLGSMLVSLPFEAWRTLVLEQRHGFNRTGKAGFARDVAMRTVLTMAIGGGLLACLFAAMQAMPDGRWMGLWFGVWVVLSVLTVVAGPVYLRVIAPLFNRFVPLRPEVATRIEALLARTGFKAGALLEMDASKRSSRGNAYVMGMGASKRIVLFDTLLDAHPALEIEAVVAHELGHVHHRHIVTGTIRGIVLLAVMLGAIGVLSRQSWLQPGFGIAEPDPAFGLVLSILLVGVVSSPLSLLGNALSRRHEYQADAFASRLVGRDAMVSALIRLARDNAAILTPDRLYSLVHHTHPPVPLRVARLGA